MKSPLPAGAVVTGRIMKILEKEVIVDIGYKSEGIINLDEFRNMKGEHGAKIGDEVEAICTGVRLEQHRA